MATRVFVDAVAAIETDGSCREYFEKLAIRDPRAYMSFLGKTITRLLQPDAGLELKAQRAVRSVEDIRDDLRRKGIPVPDSLFEPDAEREKLLAEKRELEARLRRAEAEVEALRHPPEVAPRTFVIPPRKPNGQANSKIGLISPTDREAEGLSAYAPQKD